MGMSTGQSKAGGVDVIRTSPPPSGDGPSTILGRALDILSGVSRLLEALSPADVEAMAGRLHLRLEHQADRHAFLWKVYAARHRVLLDIFATQRAELAERVRAHAALGPQSAEEGRWP